MNSPQINDSNKASITSTVFKNLPFSSCDKRWTFSSQMTSNNDRRRTFFQDSGPISCDVLASLSWERISHKSERKCTRKCSINSKILKRKFMIECWKYFESNKIFSTKKWKFQDFRSFTSFFKHYSIMILSWNWISRE